MSSSKSIAAARNRRANAPENISSSRSVPGYFPPPQQQQQQQRPNVSSNSSVYSTSTVRSSVDTNNKPNAITKLSISNAFALVTLRLGRVEQYLQKIQEEGGVLLSVSSQDNENMQMVDEGVVKSIINRLDQIEQNKFSSTTPKNIEEQFNEVKKRIIRLENNNKEIKDFLMKLQSFTISTDQKVNDFIKKQNEIITYNEELTNKLEYFLSNTDSVNVCENTDLLVPIEDPLEVLVEINEEEPFLSKSEDLIKEYETNESSKEEINETNITCEITEIKETSESDSTKIVFNKEEVNEISEYINNEISLSSNNLKEYIKNELSIEQNE